MARHPLLIPMENLEAVAPYPRGKSIRGKRFYRNGRATVGQKSGSVSKVEMIIFTLPVQRHSG